jgi:hypothetical protein
VVIDDSIVIDCYRLARFYHQNPEVFLSMPFDEVKQHLMRTYQLRQEENENNGDGN